MSLIAYLCWLLGISVPGTCDPTNYGDPSIETCGLDDDGSIPKDDGHEPPRHSRGTNISVSI